MATTLLEAAGIVNESLRTLGYEYQIDTTSNESITEGLEEIGAFPKSQRNAIMEQMNLVVQMRNYGVMFDAAKNKFRAFLVDATYEGFGIEDIFHEITDGNAPLWDDTTNGEEILKDLVSYDENKIHKIFHTESESRQFKATVDRRNYDKVFTARGVTNYIDTKLANLAWSAEVYLMQRVIAVVMDMIAAGKIKYQSGFNPNTVDGVNNIVEKMKSTVDGFKTPSNQYNYGALLKNGTYSPVVNITNSDDDVFIVTTPEYFNRIKVQGYSNAFNLSQYELEGRVIFAPAGTDFGTINDEKVLFVVLDRRAVVLAIKHWAGTSFYIPNVERTNHWLNVELLKGYNTFFNAVAFTGEELGNFTRMTVE